MKKKRVKEPVIPAGYSRDDIRKFLLSDMTAALVTIREVLNCAPAIEAVVDVYWERYRRLHEGKQEPPLDALGKEVQTPEEEME